GLPVRVTLEGASLPGTLSSVYPKIENGAVRFAVELSDPSDGRLRQSLRVDVVVVTETRSGVLRLRKGPFGASGGEKKRVFVVDGDRALARIVTFGASGRDYLEVADGLAEGDVAIVSDTTDWEHAKTLRLR